MIDGEVLAADPRPGWSLVLTKHADHDPGLTCRPALGHGLCEVLVPPDSPELT